LSSFCRHNRFISECPICAKGTVLDPGLKSGRRARSTSTASRPAARRSSAAAPTKVARGPYASAGPYGSREVRLERVPGGLRLASWRGGQLERVAPVLDGRDLRELLNAAVERGVFDGADVAALDGALGDDGAQGTSGERDFGRSPGRSGELRDELRVEPLEDGELRIARWLARPNRGWELQEAPVLLPAARFAQALADAARQGVLAPQQPIE
jgi:hypothetical protein